MHRVAEFTQFVADDGPRLVAAVRMIGRVE